MKSFSELTSASQVDNADLVAISQSTGNGYASKKTTVGDVTKNVYASNGVMGAKNLNIYPYHYESQEIRGITWTVNSDGTVTANGTATADSAFVCHSRSQTDLHNLILPNGKYIISGCPSGGSASTYYMALGRTYNGQYSGIGTDYGDGKEVTLNGDDYSATEVEVHLALGIRNGQTVNNLVFKPMIRLASDSDATFQPYAMTNLELTKAVESGGGTGGHTIIDENGNSMTARSGLQFFGAVEVRDDSENNRTLVKVLGGDFYNPVIYSTEEREIGVWTDGKPLYQKSYIGLHVEITNVNTWYDTGLSASGVEVFVVGEMIDINNQSYPVNIAFLSSNTKIGISCGMANITGVILTIRYTKTTDVAGSGTWTPQGVPTHHYSTDEQIIGTWIDGNTLYEKTYEITHTFVNGSNDIELQSNCDFTSNNLKKFSFEIVSNGISNVVSKLTDNTLYVNSSNKLLLYFECSGGLSGARTVRVTVQYTKSS